MSTKTGQKSRKKTEKTAKGYKTITKWEKLESRHKRSDRKLVPKNTIVRECKTAIQNAKQ